VVRVKAPAKPGTYTIQLTVTTADGRVRRDSARLIVRS
jgi:hypothetical protein